MTVSLEGCGGTLLARRWDERVARQPEQVRRALGELDEDPGFFQLRTLRRSRAYPEPGDTFRLEPPCCPPLEGVVVNSHVVHMGEGGSSSRWSSPRGSRRRRPSRWACPRRAS